MLRLKLFHLILTGRPKALQSSEARCRASHSYPLPGKYGTVLHAENQSKLTSQGQVSVPAAVRHLLGLTPGATVEWTQVGDSIVVKRAVRNSTRDVHEALFPQADSAVPAKTLAELKQGVRRHMQRRHARG